jgi:GTP-binding protein EngB required for normal cell division
LFAVFLIIDVNVLSPLDLQMYRLISKKFANLTIVVNKIDKITKNEVKNQVKKIINFFGVNQEQLLLISGKKGQGIAEI